MPVNETIERIVFEGIDKLSAASQSAQASTKALKDTIDGVKNVLGALGVTVGAGAFIRLQLDALHATAALQDMAAATGASVENLSAIQRVAKIGGQDFDGLTQQIGRMVKGLKENSDEGNKTASALGVLGLRARDANGHWRDTGQVLIDVAQKLSKYQDGAGKVALVQDILGKGAERYIPLLKDMAKGTDLHATETGKQAAKAKEAEESINRLKLAMEDARKETVINYTPAITRLVQEMNEGIRISGGFGQALKLGLIDPGPSIEENIAKTQNALEAYRKAGPVGRFMQKPLGSSYAGAEGDLQKRLDFLKMQRRQQMDQAASDPSSQLFDFAGGGIEKQKSLDYDSPDLAKAKRLRELIAKNTLDDEERLAQDRVAIEKVITDHQLEQIALRKEAESSSLESTVILYQESLDRRNEMDLAAADRRKLLVSQRYGRGADEQDADDAFEAKKAQLAIFTDKELEIYGGRNQLIEDLEREHQAAIFKIRLEALNRGRDMLEVGYRAQTVTVLDEIIRMTAGVSQHSKVLFEINKVATIATLALKTPEAIGSAYAFGARFGGPPLGAAMAVVAGLAMAAQMKAAVATQYAGGGAGTAPSVAGTTPAPAVSPVAASDQSSARTSITIKLVGEEQSFSTAQVRGLLERLADLTEGGARVFVG